MIAVRRAEERGHFDHGWLDTHHTFSFGDYRDPEHVRFRALRVINEDRVQPGHGFGMHGHRDMEILTCVLEGALRHSDSMGNGSVVHAGELQYMSAGTGVRHSEYNASDSEPVHLYQIWLLPQHQGLQPRYAQKVFAAADRAGRLQMVAGPAPAGEALEIRVDARIYLADLQPGAPLVHALDAGRHAWLQVLRGAVTLNGGSLRTGDGAAASAEAQLRVQALVPAEIMLFDLA